MDLSIEANSELIHGTIGEASIRGFRLAESRTNSKEQICLAWRNLAPGNRSKIPGGAGFTTGWLTAKSSARLSGVLGDGFPLTLAVRLSRAGQAVVFSQPYRDKKLSMFAGIIDLSSSGTPAERQETNLLWRKAADRSFPSYREGFGITSPLPLTALWSRWAPPATVADLESSLRLGANGLTLGFGDSPESGLPATFQLADRFVLIRTTPSDGAPWSGGANPKTGRFAGTLNLVGVARRSGLSGVFLQDQLWGDLVGLGMLAIPLPGGTFQTTEVTFRND
jgi:hypothetical protein